MSSDQKILTPQKTAQKRPENGPKWEIAPKWAKNGFLAQTPCEKFWFFGKSSISIKSWRNNRIQVSYLHLGLRSLWGRCDVLFNQFYCYWENILFSFLWLVSTKEDHPTLLWSLNQLLNQRGKHPENVMLPIFEIRIKSSKRKLPKCTI